MLPSWENVGSVNINWWEAAGEGGERDDLAAHLLSVKCHCMKNLDGKVMSILCLSDLLALTLHQSLESSFVLGCKTRDQKKIK